MDLSPEDSLRLHVLLSQPLLAVRIDESAMTVYGLTECGEAKVPLHANGPEVKYLRAVREFLSSHFLGSPGGYPVYLNRWTRMGQARDQGLDLLLLLGEPEAVVAVVHAAGLSHELARRAWWAMPTADNARRMLTRPCVMEGDVGRELVAHLLELLPFETEPQAIIESVRLILSSGFVDAATRLGLWARASRKEACYVGFLRATPDALPQPLAAHPHWCDVAARLQPLVQVGNPYAMQLCRVLAAGGQTYLQTVVAVLGRPMHQEVVVELLEALRDYFATVRMLHAPVVDVQSMVRHACELVQGAASDTPAALRSVLDAAPEWRGEIEAMLVLSCVGEPLVAPVFAATDAVGTVMRRRLAPVTDPLLAQIAVLRGVSD